MGACSEKDHWSYYIRSKGSDKIMNGFAGKLTADCGGQARVSLFA
jgi:hypothetical protein